MKNQNSSANSVEYWPSIGGKITKKPFSVQKIWAAPFT